MVKVPRYYHVVKSPEGGRGYRLAHGVQVNKPAWTAGRPQTSQHWSNAQTHIMHVAESKTPPYTFQLPSDLDTNLPKINRLSSCKIKKVPEKKKSVKGLCHAWADEHSWIIFLHCGLMIRRTLQNMDYYCIIKLAKTKNMPKKRFFWLLHGYAT